MTREDNKMPKYTVSVVEAWKYEVDAESEAEARYQVEEYGLITPSTSLITSTRLASREIVEVTEDNNAEV